MVVRVGTGQAQIHEWLTGDVARALDVGATANQRLRRTPEDLGLNFARHRWTA